MNQNQNFPTGPFYPSGMTVFFRSMAGLGAGMIGSILLFIIIFLTSMIGGLDIINKADGSITHPIFVFALSVIALIGTMSSNIMSAVFLSYAEPQKYSRLSSTLTQIFMINMILFIFVTPIYILTYVADYNFLKIVIASHAVISVMSSNLVLEIVNDYRYSLLEIYSTVVSMIFAILVAVIMFFFDNVTALIFVCMPLLWFSVGFFGGFVRMIYYVIYSSYGFDALSIDTKYGEYEQEGSIFEEDEKQREDEELEKIFEE